MHSWSISGIPQVEGEISYVNRQSVGITASYDIVWAHVEYPLDQR